jgi:hypothetical protein
MMVEMCSWLTYYFQKVVFLKAVSLFLFKHWYENQTARELDSTIK